MKRKLLLLLSIIAASATASQAQVKSGDLLLGATFGYYTSSSETNGANKSSSSNTNLSPRIAIGVGGNSVIGVKLTGSTATTKSEANDSKVTQNSFGAGAFWRKYMPIKGSIGWYLEPEAAVLAGKAKYKSGSFNNPQEQTSIAVSAAVVPGLYYSPAPNILINVDFGGVQYAYSSSRYENTPPESKIKSSQFGVNFLSSFTFGIDFVLGKKS